jgi:hypothetical protein
MKKGRNEGSKKGDEFLIEQADKQAFDFIERHAPKKLTMEQVRRHKEFENITDEEANNIIETLYQLAVIAYHVYMEQNNESSEAA